MRAILRVVCAVLAGVLLAAPVTAQVGQQLQGDAQKPNSRVGARGANFLAIPVGARGLALGGAVAADVSGITAMYWNVAGLAQAEGVGVGYSYSELYENTGITHQFGGVYLPTRWGTIGASLISLSSGEIERTTIQFPDGNDPLFGPTFEYRATSIGLHYANRLTDRFSFGGTIKSVREAVDNADVSWTGLDFGLQFVTGLYGTTIGASLLNVSGDSKWQGIQRRLSDELGSPDIVDVNIETTELPLPMMLRFSIAVDVVGPVTALIGSSPMHSLRLIGDASEAIDASPQLAVGAEYSYRSILFLRGGYRSLSEDRAPWETADRLSAGFGIQLPFDPRPRFDYAFAQFGELGSRQLFSFEMEF